MTKLSVVVAVPCLAGVVVLWSLARPARGKQTAAASYPLSARPDSLARGGAVWVAQNAGTCARRGAAPSETGGGVLGLDGWDVVPDTGGSVQLERGLDAPFRPTVLTVRTSAPHGARAIQSVRRAGRARI